VSNELPLSEALEQYAALAGYTNTYGTYRKYAAEWGKVPLGVEVSAYKDARGRWVVRRADLARGLTAERARQKRRAQAGADYKRHVLRGRDGERIWTDSDSYYERRGAFHIRYDRRVSRWEGNGRSWMCNKCWTQAVEEHAYDYCLRCDDLGDCGQDCTLSAVSCETCGVRQEIPFNSDLYRAEGTAPDRQRC
jgi:hypothetical protein